MAPRLSTSWSVFRAPRITEVTAGCASSHASDNCAWSAPLAFAISATTCRIRHVHGLGQLPAEEVREPTHSSWIQAQRKLRGSPVQDGSRRSAARGSQGNDLERTQTQARLRTGDADERCCVVECALEQVGLDDARHIAAEVDGARCASSSGFVEAHHKVVRSVLRELDSFYHDGRVVARDQRDRRAGAVDDAKRQVEPVALLDGIENVVTYADRGAEHVLALSLIHISEPTRRTPISYA